MIQLLYTHFSVHLYVNQNYMYNIGNICYRGAICIFGSILLIIHNNFFPMIQIGKTSPFWGNRWWRMYCKLPQMLEVVGNNENNTVKEDRELDWLL